MILILNGAFGVGKTTVARQLARCVAGAVVYDPERWGFVLQRLPPWMLGQAERVEDFQELPVWETLIARGVRRTSRRARLVIVPMAFSDAGRLDRLRIKLQADTSVRTICLTAPLEVVAARLSDRAARDGRPVSEFERRRSMECVLAHGDEAFGTPVDATASPNLIAAEVVRVIGLASAIEVAAIRRFA